MWVGAVSSNTASRKYMDYQDSLANFSNFVSNTNSQYGVDLSCLAGECNRTSLQGEYRAGGRVHTPSRVAPPVNRYELPQGSSTYLLTKPHPWRGTTPIRIAFSYTPAVMTVERGCLSVPIRSTFFRQL